MRHVYTLLYRPPSTFCLPKGWELIKRPMAGFEFRRDLPVSAHTFGEISYDRPLTPQEIDDYQLKPID